MWVTQRIKVSSGLNTTLSPVDIPAKPNLLYDRQRVKKWPTSGRFQRKGPAFSLKSSISFALTGGCSGRLKGGDQLELVPPGGREHNAGRVLQVTSRPYDSLDNSWPRFGSRAYHKTIPWLLTMEPLGKMRLPSVGGSAAPRQTAV